MPRLRLSDFMLVGELSRGSFGLVHKAVRKADKRTYAIKQIPLDGLPHKEKEEVVDEARVMAQLDSKYIIKYYDCFIENGQLQIVMAYAANGTLHHRIQNYPQRVIPEAVVWNYFLQTLLGLNHLHLNAILHRDLKSLNIFVDATDTCKVGDLGVAKRILRGQVSGVDHLAGTPAYLAPELLQDKACSVKSDVWALGIILYELCTKRLPFTDSTDKGLARKILAGQYTPINRADYSSGFADIVRRCLRLNPQERPDTCELLLLPVVRAKMRELGLSRSGSSIRARAASSSSAKEDGRPRGGVRPRQRNDGRGADRRTDSENKKAEVHNLSLEFGERNKIPVKRSVRGKPPRGLPPDPRAPCILLDEDDDGIGPQDCTAGPELPSPQRCDTLGREKSRIRARHGHDYDGGNDGRIYAAEEDPRKERKQQQWEARGNDGFEAAARNGQEAVQARLDPRDKGDGAARDCTVGKDEAGTRERDGQGHNHRRGAEDRESLEFQDGGRQSGPDRKAGRRQVLAEKRSGNQPASVGGVRRESRSILSWDDESGGAPHFCSQCLKDTALCSHGKGGGGYRGGGQALALTSSQTVGLCAYGVEYKPSPFARRQNPDLICSGPNIREPGPRRPAAGNGMERGRSAPAPQRGATNGTTLPTWGTSLASSMFGSRVA